jgi:indolepyruvate ferredoxin oxidoreductase
VADADIVDVRLAGIGGTGVVTAAQLLGTAAMLDGIDVRGLDQTGLSQKAGPVVSDLRLSRTVEMTSNLVGEGEADVIVAFDLLVAADSKALSGATGDHTVVVASTTTTPTGAMIGHPELSGPDVDDLTARVNDNTRADSNRFVDAGAITLGLLGTSEQANVFLLGVAVQSGALPVGPTAVERAITLNGVAVEANLTAFRWGRSWVVDPTEVEAAALLNVASGPLMDVPDLSAGLHQRIATLVGDGDLGDLLELLAADLVGFSGERCAGEFLDSIASVNGAEQRVSPGSTRLTEAVARGLHKLTAYKDEYEVARLLVGNEGRVDAESLGGPGARATWHLHPPLLAAIGVGSKLRLPAGPGRPLMTLLRHGRRLRGTPLDPFGRTRVRRLERQMLADYRVAIGTMVEALSGENLDAAVELASSAMQVRGFEKLKLQRGEAFLTDLGERLSTFA